MSRHALAQIRLLQQVQALQTAQRQRELSDARSEEHTQQQAEDHVKRARARTEQWLAAGASADAALHAWRGEIAHTHLAELHTQQAEIQQALTAARVEVDQAADALLASMRQDDLLKRCDERLVDDLAGQQRRTEQAQADDAWLQTRSRSGR